MSNAAQVEKILEEALSLKHEIERKLLVSQSPTEKASLTLELEECNEKIQKYEEELRTQPAIDYHSIYINPDLESDDPERRRKAAEKLLLQRLERLQATEGDIVVDTEFITCAEYQLFLDDNPIAYYYQPEHWTDSRFPKG